MFTSFFGLGNRATAPVSTADLLLPRQEHKDECVCFICFDVMTKPQHLFCCQKRMCLNCLMKTLRTQNRCPACRQRNIKYDRCRLTERLVENLQTKCEFSVNRSHSESCTAVFRFRDREKHQKTCPYRKVACDHCHKQILHKSLHQHDLECGAEICPQCQQKVPRREIPNHGSKCPNRLIRCCASKEGCTDRFRVQEQERHQRKCPYLKIQKLKQQIKNLKNEKKKNLISSTSINQQNQTQQNQFACSSSSSLYFYQQQKQQMNLQQHQQRQNDNFNSMSRLLRPPPPQTPIFNRTRKIDKLGIYRILISMEVRSNSSKNSGRKIGSVKRDRLIHVSELRCRTRAVYGKLTLGQEQGGWICIRNADGKEYAKHYAKVVNENDLNAEIPFPERFTTPLGGRSHSLSPTPNARRSAKRKRRESIDDLCNEFLSLNAFKRFRIS